MKIYNNYVMITSTVVPVQTLKEIIEYIKTCENVVKINHVMTANDKYKEIEGYSYNYKDKNIIEIDVEIKYDITESKVYDNQKNYSKMERYDIIEEFNDEIYSKFDDIELDVRRKFNLDELETVEEEAIKRVSYIKEPPIG